MSKLGVRYALVILSIIAACITVISAVFYFQLQQSIRNYEAASTVVVERGLQDMERSYAYTAADSIAEALKSSLYLYSFHGIDDVVELSLEEMELKSITVFDEKGREVSNGIRNFDMRNAVDLKVIDNLTEEPTLAQIVITNDMVQTTRLIEADGQVIGGFQFVRGRDEMALQLTQAKDALHESALHSADQMLISITIAGLITAVLGAAASLTIGNRLSRPINQLVKEARRISEGEFGRSMRVTRNDEIGDLCHAFNDMSTNLESGRKAQEEIARNEQERIAAELANKTKSEFLASVSHELRTPLNGILGMAQVLASSKLTDDQQDWVSTILESGNTLTALLTDVLDLSKIEAGKLEIAPIDDDLSHTLSHLRRLFKPVAEEKGLTLDLSVNSDVPPRLSFDPVRIRQCVSNLISNAIKFTDEGEVTVRAEAKQEKEGYRIKIVVRDTGIGMDEATCGRLFQPFMQADASITRRFGGTGLGLHITKRLAEMMDGAVAVESVPGEGSTFTFQFFAKAAAQEQPTEQMQDQTTLARRNALAALQGRRILLVEDNEVNRRVAGLFLRPLGAEIVEAENGVRALEKIEQQDFALVLMDVHMPEMDGFEATAEIRARDWPARYWPIVALTADAMSGDRERCLAAGMDEYAPKPLDARTLYAAIALALDKRKGEEANAAIAS